MNSTGKLKYSGFEYLDIDDLTREDILQALDRLKELELQEKEVSTILMYYKVRTALLRKLVQLDKDFLNQCLSSFEKAAPANRNFKGNG